MQTAFEVTRKVPLLVCAAGEYRLIGRSDEVCPRVSFDYRRFSQQILGAELTSFRQERERDVIIFRPAGRLGFNERPSCLQECVKDCIERGFRHLLVDLASVSAMDKAGLRELLIAYAIASLKGGSLKLVNLDERLEEGGYSGLLSAVFEVFDDETLAIGSFQSNRQSFGLVTDSEFRWIDGRLRLGGHASEQGQGSS